MLMNKKQIGLSENQSGSRRISTWILDFRTRAKDFVTRYQDIIFELSCIWQGSCLTIFPPKIFPSSARTGYKKSLKYFNDF